MSQLLKTLSKDAIYWASSPLLRKIKKFRNIHKGESCYIFGDGISLKAMDLSRFTDKQAIAGNYVPFHKKFSALSCAYCVMTAPFFFSPITREPRIKRNHILGMARLYRELIRTYPQKNFFTHLSNYPFIGGGNLYFMYKNIPDDRLPPDFLGTQINCFAGVLNTSILLAVYLGFDHVYLVGCDYTHVPSRTLHWYEKGEGVFCEQPNYQKEFFRIAREFVDITTITVDGTSDYIDAITYEEFTGCAPMFRENSELADARVLKALSTWPGYSIY